MYGATSLAAIPLAAAALAERLGIAVQRDPDFMPGLGTFDFFSIEIDDRVLCTIASSDLNPGRSTVIAHALADLPAIAHALGLTAGDLIIVGPEPPKPWRVVRVDDNGNRYVLNRCESQGQATRAADIWSRRIGAHHQVVLVESAD